MGDYLVRAMAADAQIRAFAVSGRELVETARAAHNTSPVVTAGLGRLMIGAVMMGSMLKGEDDLLTLQIRGDGPAGGLVVTADAKGRVKGYALNPGAVLPANAIGKLDVGGSLGAGTLTVIKDMGLKDPYSSQIDLQTGEIGDDLSYYFAVSEQVPSGVGLGVLMNRDNTVAQAGGFIIQLMPFASDEIIQKLEDKLSQITSVTALFADGNTPEQVLEIILGDLGLEITDTMPVEFYCNCSKSRVERVLLSLGRKELQDIINDGKPITLNCHFCNKDYEFTIPELQALQRENRGK